MQVSCYGLMASMTTLLKKIKAQLTFFKKNPQNMSLILLAVY